MKPKEYYRMMSRIIIKAKREKIVQNASLDRLRRYLEKNPRRGLQTLID